ncbi:c-type cytochrome domain-containing protein [Pontibacter sp. G13]|uniref:c-type cytochrome domain-containing protein n=1 Tax=Pontibacter sp. G13 TaxID=3074898 RepID=UPI00288BD0CD|nr:c-type cytochrome domain-containing protein [Pontibacter sp. G13]WNJ18116.1 c-type cytochrome domain-containing protein [Pontibacter sp. G13]
MILSAYSPRNLLIIGFAVMIWSGCQHDPVTPSDPTPEVDPEGPELCDPDTMYYDDHILPILERRDCIACHTASNNLGGVVLTSYDELIQSDIVDVNDPNSSELIRVVTTNDPDEKMPPAPDTPLNEQEVNTLRTWIGQGALNIACTSEECDVSDVSFSSDVEPIIQNRCESCHRGAAPQGGVLLDSYSSIAQYARNGRLWGAINHDTGFEPMPPGGPDEKLSDCELLTIKQWITEDAPQN